MPSIRAPMLQSKEIGEGPHACTWVSSVDLDSQLDPPVVGPLVDGMTIFVSHFIYIYLYMPCMQ
jgi:hypothetical protein